jgi:hypothetical protein
MGRFSSCETVDAATAIRFARAGLWLIPIYGVLLALSTLTHQPDYETDFQGYAEYITTDRFLASHLGASIAGAALGLLGVVAALAFLVRGPAVTAAILGTAFTIIGNVLVTALFGVAAFAQPAIGRAFLEGASGVPELNDDVYGTPLFATAAIGLVFFVAGGILLGVAIARIGRPLRWVGIGFGASLRPLRPRILGARYRPADRGRSASSCGPRAGAPPAAIYAAHRRDDRLSPILPRECLASSTRGARPGRMRRPRLATPDQSPTQIRASVPS